MAIYLNIHATFSEESLHLLFDENKSLKFGPKTINTKNKQALKFV